MVLVLVLDFPLPSTITSTALRAEYEYEKAIGNDNATAQSFNSPEEHALTSLTAIATALRSCILLVSEEGGGCRSMRLTC